MSNSLRTDNIVPIGKVTLPSHFHAIQQQLLQVFGRAVLHGGSLRDYYTGLNTHRDLDFHVREARPGSVGSVFKDFLDPHQSFKKDEAARLSEEFQAATGMKPLNLSKSKLSARMICEWNAEGKKETLDVSLHFGMQEKDTAGLRRYTIGKSNVPFCAIAMDEESRVQAHALFEDHAAQRIYRIRPDIPFKKKLNTLVHYEKIKRKYPDLKLETDIHSFCKAGYSLDAEFFTKLRYAYQAGKGIASGASAFLRPFL